ncbi:MULTISPECIES: hypothetical protein [Acinetobacter]|uniref:hypothetical protein n=1 Tax=Acinetobacter TaxID=469 RepID=UPI0005C6F621|nr:MULTISPECIES: hypothetical protein [Acinetobacter]
MTQLINKGGFRERANRSRKYKQSENEITTLPPSHYQPQTKEIGQPAGLNQTSSQQYKKDDA